LKTPARGCVVLDQPQQPPKKSVSGGILATLRLVFD
jgi:hypothetical protein